MIFCLNAYMLEGSVLADGLVKTHSVTDVTALSLQSMWVILKLI